MTLFRTIIFTLKVISLFLLGNASIIKATTPIVDVAQIRDQQILSTYKGTPGLVAQVDKTRTQMGKHMLTNVLVTPTDNIDRLKAFQAATKAVITNPVLAQKLDEELAKFAKNEAEMQMQTTDPIGQKATQDFYFQNKYLQVLNKYPSALFAGLVANTASVFAPLVEHAALHFFLGHAGCSHSHAPKKEKHAHAHGAQCCGGHDHSHKEKHSHDNASNVISMALLGYKLYNAAHFALHAINFKDMCGDAVRKADLIQEMQKKLICVRGCIDCAKAITIAVQANPEMIANLTHVAQLASLVDATKAQNLSPELQEFLALIKTDTFASQSSKLSHYGRILRAHDLMQKVQPELKVYLQGVAEVDLHASCAKLVQENKSTATPYTFADYVHDNRARLAIQGFWNPLVPKPKAISQEVALGGQNPQVAVVTGANTGGKSTSLANIGSAVHLSQTLGIAPAQKLELTPFAKTITGFNMTTRVGDGQSLFSTSLDLANKVLTVTKNGSTEKVFIALDELFNSTDHTKGQAVAIEFVKRMMEKENAVMFFATHFPKLAQLEAESAGKCRNLKAENVDGVYQITPGASNGTQAFKLISHGDSLLVKE